MKNVEDHPLTGSRRNIIQDEEDEDEDEFTEVPLGDINARLTSQVAFPQAPQKDLPFTPGGIYAIVMENRNRPSLVPFLRVFIALDRQRGIMFRYDDKDEDLRFEPRVREEEKQKVAAFTRLRPDIRRWDTFFKPDSNGRVPFLVSQLGVIRDPQNVAALWRMHNIKIYEHKASERSRETNRQWFTFFVSAMVTAGILRLANVTGDSHEPFPKDGTLFDWLKAHLNDNKLMEELDKNVENLKTFLLVQSGDRSEPFKGREDLVSSEHLSTTPTPLLKALRGPGP